MRSPLGVALAVLIFVAACAPAIASTEEPNADGDLTVFAAASLRDVFVTLEQAWEAQHPGSALTIAHDGSNILAAQIGEGAQVDVFASADLERPRQLAAAGLTYGDVVPFAMNRVTLVTPTGTGSVGDAADLALPGLRIVAAGPSVPITHYADEALAQLAATMTDADAFAAAVAANVVSREDNVRAALAKVELGEGDAAFVYRTDARSSDDVREIALPTSVDVEAVYAAVPVSERPLAMEFLAWLAGPQAADILVAAGFEVPGP